MIRALLDEARPKQWGKNVLVFAAPAAAGVLDDGQHLSRAVVVFVAFCLVSSGTYYWNDIRDVVEDRTHPKKRFRPIAAGRIPLPFARIVGSALLVGGIALGFATTEWKAVVVLAAYAVVTVLYSVRLKHIAVLDIVVVAGGFVLRAFGGAKATNVPVSPWFIVVTVFGSLFIVTGKRYAEMRELGDTAASTRPMLAAYSLSYLQMVLGVSIGGTLLAYCQWAFTVAEIAGGDVPWYELSIVPMVIALLRYLLILDQGKGAAPEEVFASDRVLQAAGAVWLLIFLVGVYQPI